MSHAEASPEPPSKSVRPTGLVGAVAAAVALSITGDSLMYSLLPLEAGNLGVALPLVGVLLSANRIIRLFSNTWAGLTFERWGPRLPFIFAAALGFVTAALYGAGWGFLVFLLARAGWGVAWSIFRQAGYQAVWAAPEAVKGRLMGVLWGVVRLGSAVSVLLGGFLYDRYGYQAAVAAIAAIAFLAVPVAALIRWPQSAPRPRSGPRAPLAGWREAFESAPRRWVLAVGFMDTLFEGVLVSTASLFLATRLPPDSPLFVGGVGIGTLAGFLLALRFSANLFFSPLLGALSDRLGQPPAIALLALVVFGGMTGAVTLSGVWTLVCLALVFFAASGIFTAENAAASGLANQTERPHLFVGFFTTSIDAGAAVGPLLAYSLGEGLVGLEALYALVAALLLLAALRYWWVERRALAAGAGIPG